MFPSVRCSATDPPSVSCGSPTCCGLYALRGRFLTAPGNFLPIQLHRVPDRIYGFLGAGEVLDVDLLVFQLFVVFEKASQLIEAMLGQLVEALVGAVLGVFEGDADDLLVVLAVVDHVHHAYGPNDQKAQRLDGLLHEHEHVERVAVVAQGPGNKPVVGRVVDGRVEDAVYLQEPRGLVQLVLHLRALGDLDQRLKLRGRVLTYLHVMPGMRHLHSSRSPRDGPIANPRPYFSATRTAKPEPPPGRQPPYIVPQPERKLPMTRGKGVLVGPPALL